MWQNNVKYESPKRFDFRLNDFTGGICNTVTESRIKENEASDLLNVRFDQDGVLKKRCGFSLDKKYSSLLHGFTGDLLRVFVIEPHHTHEKGYLLLIDNKNLVYVTTDGRVKKLYWNRPSTTTKIDGCQFNNSFYFVDGQWEMNMYKIEELEAQGDDTVWLYKIRQPNEGFTPKPSPAVKGNWVEKPYPGAEDRAKVRYYEPCQLELEDGYKGTNNAHGFFATMIRVHKDRLYVAGNLGTPPGASSPKDPEPNMIYISDIMNPEYFPASLPLQVPPTGDKITCLRQFNDALIVGRKNDVYAINGNTNRADSSQEFTLKRINTHTGFANNYCADMIYNFLFYVGSDGNCYKLTSTSTSELLLATQQVNQKIDFKLSPFNKTLSEIKDCHTGFDPIRGEWHVQIGDDTFVYNYRNYAWVRWKGVECKQFIPSDEHFYYVKQDGSFNIIDEDKYYDTWVKNPDVKIPIQMYWISKNMDFNMPSRVKQIRDTFLISEIVEGHPSTIRVKYEADYVAVTKENNIASEIALWDLARWDVHRFVYKNIIRSMPIMVGRRCRNFKVYIGNGYDFVDIVEELPEPYKSKEGQLYYLENKNKGVDLFDTTIEIGGVESTNGTAINDNRYIRSVGSIVVEPNSTYSFSVDYKRPNLVGSVLMYDADGKYLTSKYISYEDGFLITTTSDTAKIRLSFRDATSEEPLTLQEITRLEIRKYLHLDDGDSPLYPDGFYLRGTRNPDTRDYYKKMYDKDLYQAVKVHEINGIYELKGYR